MATRTIPLKDLMLDPEQPADLAALPVDEALARLRPAYEFLGAGATVTLADDLVTISVPDVSAGQAREALSWSDEALRLAQRGEYKKAVRLFHTQRWVRLRPLLQMPCQSNMIMPLL